MITAGPFKENQLHSGPRLPSPSIKKNKPAASQSLLPVKFITHHPRAGLNPLVDAAAYLFSIIGKLKQLKSFRHLHKLQKELILEINSFQEAAKTQGYSTEYILVSRYALCATLDNIIANTAWGTQGQWETHSLLLTYNQENTTQDRFFIILERILKDPGVYLDLLEFMYICLSLGFRGSYRSTEFSSSQLDQISQSLYKHIRTQQKDFNKALAPFPIRHVHAQAPSSKKNSSLLLTALTTMSLILAVFIGLSCMLDKISNQAYEELIHLGKSILYENTSI